MIDLRINFIKSNMRSGGMAFGSDDHLNISENCKDTIIRRLDRRYKTLSAFQAMRIISRIPDDVFPRTVQDELINHINGMVDPDLDMEGETDIGLTEMVAQGACDGAGNAHPPDMRG